jgi:hypothetical protein
MNTLLDQEETRIVTNLTKHNSLHLLWDSAIACTLRATGLLDF